MYYVVYSLLYLLSLLPLWVLHRLSDLAYVIIYYGMGYRKKVVMDNLATAFPHKTASERTAIARRFYRNFTDTFIESIKLLSAGNRFLDRHFKADMSIFQRLYAEGKKCQIHLGHNFNWEMGNLAITRSIPHKLLGVYAPIGSPVFDRIFRKLRSRLGSVLLPANDMKNAMMPWRNELYALGLIADQNPRDPAKAFWVSFFGKPAPFVTGPENGARLANIPVVFCYITKEKRGHYQGHFILAEEHPAALPKGALTLKYIRFLEKVIAQSPDMWLWSHRRWKHQWRPELGLLEEAAVSQ